MKGKISRSLMFLVLILMLTPTETFASEPQSAGPELARITRFSDGGDSSNKIQIHWEYGDDFDTSNITSVEVGVKDADGDILMCYTADQTTVCDDEEENPDNLNQIEWQTKYGTMKPGEQCAVSMFQIDEQSDYEITSAWTIATGKGYGQWSPDTAYVKVTTDESAFMVEDNDFIGEVYPDMIAFADGKYYYDLHKAIINVPDNGVIEILRNNARESYEDDGYVIPQNKTITIIGNGYHIHRTCADLDASGGYRGHAILALKSGSHLILDNVYLSYYGNRYGKDPDNSLTNICMGTGIASYAGNLTLTNDSELELSTLNRGIFSLHESNFTVEDGSSIVIKDTNYDATSLYGNYILSNHGAITIDKCGGRGLSSDSIVVSDSIIEVTNAGLIGICANELEINASTVKVKNCGWFDSNLPEYDGKGAFQMVQREGQRGPTISMNGANIIMSNNGNSDFENSEIIYTGYGTVRGINCLYNCDFIPATDSNKHVAAARDMHRIAKVETVHHGEYFVLPPDPGYADYTFLAWTDGKTEYPPESNVQIDENKFFTCVWGDVPPATPEDPPSKPEKPSQNDNSSSQREEKIYEISVTNTDNGFVKVGPKSAHAGTRITVIASPDNGYMIDSITVEDINGNKIPTAQWSMDTFTFIMPNKKVDVSVKFITAEAPDNSAEHSFADVNKNAWYAKAVSYVSNNKIMSGVSKSKFAPDNHLTRAMAIQIVYGFAGKPEISETNQDLSYTDITESSWYTNAVHWGTQKEVVSGVSNGAFAPEEFVTREQLAVIMFKYSELAGCLTENQEYSLTMFTDGNEVSEWARPAMEWAVSNGLITGQSDSKLAPFSFATRAEVAQIFMKFSNMVECNHA